jgi:hypothetical protein
VKFTTGLSKPGNYVVFLLQNDGYNIVVRETISVSESTATEIRLLSASPANNATGLTPAIAFSANFTNTAKIVTNSIVLSVDNQSVKPTAVLDNNSIQITYTNQTLYPPKSTHLYQLVFSDASRAYTNTWNYTVADYQDIILPQPIYFESFDNIPEGQLPSGWTEKSYTEVTNPDVDFGNLDSAAYAKWTVVNADRFNGSFTTYSNPDASEADKNDYKRVLSINPLVVVNGKLYTEPLAKGRFLFSNSGYRNGKSQVDYVFTKDFNLSGQKDVYLSYHSLWEQNQDSMAAVEYSIDGGQNWLPVVYMVDQPDVLTATNAAGVVGTDAVATFTTQRSDIALYTDENGAELGGTYGAFIAAPISQDLALFISPRVNDSPIESKRIELFRIDKADNQSRVRFRFAHAGTDSWYFGIDDFGLYSISKSVAAPVISISKTGDSVLISWPADASGFVLESTGSLASPQWQAVTGVSNNSVTQKIGQTQYFRLRK